MNGIGIDAGFFAEMSRRLGDELRLIREDIYRVAGTEFNINSTPQLREILFERLELPVLKRTKTDRPPIRPSWRSWRSGDIGCPA